MEKGQNPNHPKAGSRITVEPIRNLKDIQAIKNLLADSPLYTAYFTLGINTNLRAGDLLGIKVNQVRGLKPLEEIIVYEEKTKKPRRINLNKACTDAIRALLAFRNYQPEDYLFMGQRGPLTVGAVSRLVKSWCKAIRLQGNYASHTLRKTWAYHQRCTYNVGLPVLMTCLNHSNQRQTLSYMCVQPEEIKGVYANVL